MQPGRHELTHVSCSSEGERGLVDLRRFFADRMAGRHALGMPERRQRFADLMSALFPQHPVPWRLGHCGNCPAEIHAPPSTSPRATILYLHGGAYVTGGPVTHRRFCGTLAALAESRVVALDYRLAPEHPYPAAIDDAVAAFDALAREGDGEAILVGGDSAGGGLTLALAQRLRDAGGPVPAGLLLLSPFVDLTFGSDSHRRLADRDPFLTTAGLAADVGRYIPDPMRRREPCASPLFADLRDLPPTLLQIGTDEILLDEGLELAARFRSAGVATTTELWDGMVHNWHLFPNWLPEADRATAALARFIDRIAAEAALRPANAAMN